MSIIINVLYNHKSYIMADKRSMHRITGEITEEDSNKLIMLSNEVCIGHTGIVSCHIDVLNKVSLLMKDSQLPLNATNINNMFLEAIQSIEFDNEYYFTFLITGKNSEGIMTTYKIDYSDGKYETGSNIICNKPGIIRYTISPPSDINKIDIESMFDRIIMNNFEIDSESDDWVLQSMQELINGLAKRSKVINSKTDYYIIS